MTGLYILKNKEVIPCDDPILWLQNREDDNWIVGQDYFQDGPDEFLISTVFTGAPYHFEDAEPLFFETMIFKNGCPICQLRYTTWIEAYRWHGTQCDYYSSSSFSRPDELP